MGELLENQILEVMIKTRFNLHNPNYMATNKNDRTSGRGFASMDPNKQREIASKGGKAAHESGRAHEFTPEEAREAGRRGGLARTNSE